MLDYYEAVSIKAAGGDAWTAKLADARPSLESQEVKDTIRIISSGSFREIFLTQAKASLLLQTVVMALVFFWDALIAMVFGMALYRIGFLSLQLPRRTYLLVLILGYGIGLPVSIWETVSVMTSDFDPVSVAETALTYDLGRFAMALGHACLILLLCMSGVATRVKSALAATGRMAFTNYLSQSILGALIFYSFGLGLYGKVPGVYMYAVVLAIWIVQITWSVFWLKRYRFGPFEWLWRSLTYGRWQPMT